MLNFVLNSFFFVFFIKQVILPYTLCRFRPSSKVLIFGGDTKVYWEKTSEQNIAGHLCPLIGPIC